MILCCLKFFVSSAAIKEDTKVLHKYTVISVESPEYGLARRLCACRHLSTQTDGYTSVQGIEF